jgi:hypothetical protein
MVTHEDEKRIVEEVIGLEELERPPQHVVPKFRMIEEVMEERVGPNELEVSLSPQAHGSLDDVVQ